MVANGNRRGIGPDRPGSRTRGGRSPRGRPRLPAGGYERSARRQLRTLRQGSLLAVAVTGLMLALTGVADAPGQEPPRTGLPTPGAPPAPEPQAEERPPVESETEPAGDPRGQAAPPEPAELDTAKADPERAAREATRTLRDFIVDLYDLLPKIGVAIAILLAAAMATRIAPPLLRKLLRSWEKGEATSALVGIGIWLLALGAALSVIAGDVRALVGSVGLFGLALSWALQTPIESFTGWLMNSFKAYYRIGDRIAVGDVFGDVYAVDFLTTTVWEVGGPEKPVEGEQATGALVTFPNSEVLRSNIVNFTRDFPFVWDEITINIADESDLPYTARVFGETARRVVGRAMTDPAQHYQRLLETAGLAHDIAAEPQVFFATTEAFVNVTVRYLIPARERRVWSSTLIMALAEELTRAEHQSKVIPGFPRAQVEITGSPWQLDGTRERPAGG